MAGIKIDDVTDDEYDVIDRGLVDFNNSKVPFTQETTKHINKCIKLNDEVIAGILADVYCWHILGVDAVWVKEEYRGKGHARKLVECVEEEARKMGCKIAHLDTFDFQAKGLCEKLGYVVFGTLEDCPRGMSVIIC